ncbi:hypothetical protein PTRA_a0415 [Pseudoalteromonas translucida KMM 520]|uniref:Uncharacterized protein n=1 Tax=Pseudoalteromonas translucida KMM 520 TaxID=1315283 RepID=A0A0U2IRY3_9GAMM|nr:hypothetical protein PTRA_a0415 [Pseudoalteromonas translucida KMM 520]
MLANTRLAFYACSLNALVLKQLISAFILMLHSFIVQQREFTTVFYFLVHGLYLKKYFI